MLPPVGCVQVRQLEWDTLGAAGAGKLGKQGPAADGERAAQLVALPLLQQQHQCAMHTLPHNLAEATLLHVVQHGT